MIIVIERFINPHPTFAGLVECVIMSPTCDILFLAAPRVLHNIVLFFMIITQH